MRTLRTVFWVLAVGIITAYVFFLFLGAYTPGEVPATTIVVLVLTLGCTAYALFLSRQPTAGRRDPLVTRDRERRGF